MEHVQSQQYSGHRSECWVLMEVKYNTMLPAFSGIGAVFKDTFTKGEFVL